MKRRVVYFLSSGQMFFDTKAAEKAADKNYGEALSRLAHRLVREEKYSAMMTFVDENLDRFIELRDLKEDIKLVEEKLEDE